MTASPARRFTLADAMVLVAATALGLLPTRQVVEHVRFRFSESPSLNNVLHFIAFPAVMVATPCAVSWTLALLPLRLRPPRPDRRRLVRQPGFIATCVFGVIGGSLLTSIWIFSGFAPDRVLTVTLFLLPLVGAGIGGVRLTLWMVGHRRPPADWVERLGRVLGWYWILAALITFYTMGI